MIQTAEDKVKEYCQCIRREIEHWKVINQNGCNDPFWSDGCNMNLTRNHIIYYQRQLREICTENRLPLPDEYYLAVPPEVDMNYMANLKAETTGGEIASVREDHDWTHLSVRREPDEFILEPDNKTKRSSYHLP